LKYRSGNEKAWSMPTSVSRFFGKAARPATRPSRAASNTCAAWRGRDLDGRRNPVGHINPQALQARCRHFSTRIVDADVSSKIGMSISIKVGCPDNLSFQLIFVNFPQARSHRFRFPTRGYCKLEKFFYDTNTRIQMPDMLVKLYGLPDLHEQLKKTEGMAA